MHNTTKIITNTSATFRDYVEEADILIVSNINFQMTGY